ncbi:MAG: tRNA pseudouridine(55) synthase TruB [Calditrichaeota bacterium]|nr:MAG: tRNA pseudouridine(55) synthase TruB [Calditrichota bacterium]
MTLTDNNPPILLEELKAGKILAVNKPADWTSFDVVNKLRRVSKIKKVGHAGTLDPFATGLLLICFAKATKQVNELVDLEKEYEGTIVLGTETDTHDLTGKIRATHSVPELKIEDLENVIAHYRGEIEQIPPMYSAVKHKGQRLYQLARKGKQVERPARKVKIFRFDILSLNKTSFDFRIVCSKGTYIRALARDIGRELGCGAYVHRLVRTRIGSYRLEHAWDLDALVKQIKSQHFDNGNIR